MANKFPTDPQARICSTCEYWGGERDLDFRGGKLLYVQAQYNPQPRCTGPKLNTSQAATNRCTEYKRWHKLPD